MPADTHRVHALLVAREDIRALARQPFALAAAAAVLGLVAFFAAFAPEGPSGVRDQLIFFWIVAELVVAVVLAARIASARRSRFVDSLYTTPLEARAWLGGQVLVGAFLATLILLAQVPFLLVHVALVGIPPLLGPLVLAAVGIAAFAVAFGAFCGVVVGDAGPGAAAGLAGGVGFLSFIMLLLHGISAIGPPSSTDVFMLRVTALSPLALVIDATGIDIFGVTPQNPWRPVVGMLALVAGLGGAAWVAYTRCQSPIGWEPRRGRAVVVGLVSLALVVPVVSAAVNYREIEEPVNFALSHGDHTRVTVATQGTPIDDDAFSLEAQYDLEELVQGQENARDVLVMLLVGEDDRVRDVEIDIKVVSGAELVSGGSVSVPDGAPGGRARQGETFDPDAEPTGPVRPVFRVPVVLRPVDPEAVIESPVDLEITTTFVMDGRTYTSTARRSLDADIDGGSTMLLAAGAPLPLAALAAVVARRIRTR